MQNFQKITTGVDVLPLRHALMLVPELWDKYSLRKRAEQHAGVQSIILRCNPYSKGQDINDVLFGTHCENYPAAALLPRAWRLVMGLMAQVEGEELGRVVIARARPGETVHPHTDLIPNAPAGAVQPAEYYQRYHIVVQSQPGCVFTCGDESVQMGIGEVWWFDNTKVHSVVNNSPDDRVHLIVDIRAASFNYTPGFE